MYIDPVAVRDAWNRGGARAIEQLTGVDSSAAAGRDLADLARAMAWAAGELRGITAVGAAILTETDAQVENSLATYAATDRQSAGTFHRVEAPEQ